MKKIILPSIVLLLITSACKKNTNTTAAPAATSNTTTSSYYGTLSAKRTVSTIFSPSIDTSYGCDADFYNTAQPLRYNYSPGNLVSAGSVSLGSVQTRYQSNYYSDSTGTLKLNNLVNWNIGGAGAIPAFTYSYTPVWPDYANSNLLPDTIHLGQNTTLQLSGMSNVDKVEIGLFNPTTGAYQGTSQNFIAANTNFTFSSTGLSNFSSGSSCYLSVIMFNPVSEQTFGGKKFFFYSQYAYVKMAYIK